MYSQACSIYSKTFAYVSFFLDCRDTSLNDQRAYGSSTCSLWHKTLIATKAPFSKAKETSNRLETEETLKGDWKNEVKSE